MLPLMLALCSVPSSEACDLAEVRLRLRKKLCRCFIPISFCAAFCGFPSFLLRIQGTNHAAARQPSFAQIAENPVRLTTNQCSARNSHWPPGVSFPTPSSPYTADAVIRKQRCFSSCEWGDRKPKDSGLSQDELVGNRRSTSALCADKQASGTALTLHFRAQTAWSTSC